MIEYLKNLFVTPKIDEDMFHNTLIYTFYKNHPRIKYGDPMTIEFDTLVDGGLLERSSQAGANVALIGVEILEDYEFSLPFNVEIRSVKKMYGCYLVKGSYQVYTK